MPLTEAALDLMVYLRFALRWLLYARVELVHVAADLFVYYESRNPRKKVAPDVAVTYGVPQEPRRAVFRTWEEGARPSFVAEISSADSREEDRGFKFGLYRDVLGCREYLIYDEAWDQLDLFRREGEELLPVEPDERGRLYSEELGCWFGREPGILVRVFDPLGMSVLSEWEQSRRAEAEHRRANEEARRAEAEQHRANEEQRRATDERRRATDERRRANEEHRRAEAEQGRADEEHRRAEALAAEVERLRALLSEQRS